MESDYKVQLYDIIEYYRHHEENGARSIKLQYDDANENLIIAISCTDDCEPYWNHSEDIHCTLKNWAIILAYIVDGMLFDERTGKKYPVLIDWEWYK